jgi:hypothetical protein
VKIKSYIHNVFKLILILKYLIIMSKVMFDYTKSVLERVSFDVTLFCKELEKAIKSLLPHEMELLREWLSNFIIEKPELKQSLIIINK